jgi:pilus assembly protein Flp/PilA
MKWLDRFLKDEEGATAAEYAFLVGLIALAIITGAYAVGTSINDKISNVAGSVGS